MAVPTLVGSAVARNNGTSTVTLTVPSGLQNGDLLIAFTQAGATSASFSNWAAQGWHQIFGTGMNTRYVSAMARIYDSASPTAGLSLTLATSSSCVWVVVAVRGHGVETLSTALTVGTVWRRADNGGSQALITLPGVTTPDDNMLVLGATYEATSSAGTYTSTAAASGFSLYAERVEDSVIEWVTVWQKSMSDAGASGSFSLTYPSASNNGAGFQLAIPGSTDVIPSTGQIKSYGALGIFSDTLVMASRSEAAGVIEAVLYDDIGSTELERVSVTHDATTKWGHALFEGLSPNSSYTVKYELDGVEQTDVIRHPRTVHGAGGEHSFKFVTGSCNYTGSNHPVWDAIAAIEPMFLSHQGDFNYSDANTDTAWRVGMDTTFQAAKFASLLDIVPMEWKPDNHDRIITNPTGTGTGLNLGETDPLTNTQWRHLSGTAYPTSDTLGRSWKIGRVAFIHTDMWSARDDGDGDPAPRTFLGAAQKEWFLETLEDYESDPTVLLIVWFCQWTARNNGNGRWNSFPEETTELETFINNRPALKRKMVMMGGDSHSIQVDDGSRTGTGYRFNGIPSLNISGFNRSADAGDGSTGWSIANMAIRKAGVTENTIGGFAEVEIVDNGYSVTMHWKGIVVYSDGITADVVGLSRIFSPYDSLTFIGDDPALAIFVGSHLVSGRDTSYALDPGDF